ncbi:MAG TPA: hypothetical protein VGW40_15115 [Allosphingosinicella sp.]|nr:hypothetical protein [Allosphingosinicella sp.]
MELPRPIPALLISAVPNGAGQGRCRLLAGQSAATNETPVRVSRLTARGCLIADCPAAPAAGAQTWLKLPGREAVGIGIEPGPEGGLACAFFHPLYPAELEALLAPDPPEPRRHDRPKARCTIF